jgi:hypothetical protein
VDLGEVDRRREIETAILETVLYSDLFDYPLTRTEIAHYLIRVRADVESVSACLDAPRYLNGHLRHIGGYICARRREMLVERRRARQAASARLWIRARRFARVLAAMPFVRMVAITGALAMDNSAPGDDIDVLMVSARGRAWTARLFAVGLVWVGKLLGDTLCPNYVISEDALAIERHDVFTAHEFAQMAPLVGLSVYDQLRRANLWVYDLLPNAFAPLRQRGEIRPGRMGRAIQRLSERLLGGRLGHALETWEMRRKQRKFAPKITQGSDAILDRDHVKGHFNDYGVAIRHLYAERLAQFPLVEAQPGLETDRPGVDAPDVKAFWMDRV